MAYKLTNQEYCAFTNDYRREYICDTDADFAALPKECVGSVALSVATGTMKMVNASGEWVNFAG